MVLNKSDILKAQDLKTESVKVPEWGGEVIIRTMTGSERDSYEQRIVRGNQKNEYIDIRATFLSLTIIDDKGERLFDEQDIKALGGKSAAALDRLFEVAQKLNGLRNDDIEELAGN